MTKAIFMISVAIAAATVPAAAQDWTAEIYGGAVLERSEVYNSVTFDLNSGTALGIGVYSNRIVSWAELGLDVMRTDAGYIGFLSSVESVSLMVNARFPFEVGPGATAYVGAGLGAIKVTYDGSTEFPAFTGSDTVAGGQLSLGGRFDVGPSTRVFGELKHQVAFGDAEIQGIQQSYKSTNVVIGLSLSF